MIRVWIFGIRVRIIGIAALCRQDCGVALLCSDAPEAERPAASALQHAAVSTLVPPLPPAAMRAATRGQREELG